MMEKMKNGLHKFKSIIRNIEDKCMSNGEIRLFLKLICGRILKFKSINVLLRGGNHNEKILSIRILSIGVY